MPATSVVAEPHVHGSQLFSSRDKAVRLGHFRQVEYKGELFIRVDASYIQTHS
jgi:hypothetical protein